MVDFQAILVSHKKFLSYDLQDQVPEARCLPQGSMSKAILWLVVGVSLSSLYKTPDWKRTSQHHISGSALAPVKRKLPSGANSTCFARGKKCEAVVLSNAFLTLTALFL